MNEQNITGLALLLMTTEDRMTQAALAQKCGTNQAALSRYLSGARNLADVPDVADLLALYLAPHMEPGERTRRFLSERFPCSEVREVLLKKFKPSKKVKK